jgi:hypothetical protein
MNLTVATNASVNTSHTNRQSFQTDSNFVNNKLYPYSDNNEITEPTKINFRKKAWPVDTTTPPKITQLPPQIKHTLATDHTSWSIRVNGESHTLQSNFKSINECITYLQHMAFDYSKLDINQITTNVNTQREKFLQYLTNLAKIYGKGKGEEIAESTAAGFVITEDMLKRDRTALQKCNNSIHQLILTNFESKKQTGSFSGTTVNQIIDQNDIEYNAIYSIAENGATFRTDPSFCPNNTPTNPLRELQRRMPHTFNKHCHKLWDKGRGLLLRYGDISMEDRKKLNFASLHWRFEPLKPLGRLLIDLSNSDNPQYLPLNGGTAKQDAIDDFGKIEHPTITNMIQRWKQYMQQHGLSWGDMYISSDDIEQAFPRINYQPQTAVLMCAVVSAPVDHNIDNTIIFIYTSGCMGGTATCGIFETIGRPLSRAIQNSIQSVHDRYCDDMFVVGAEYHIIPDKVILHDKTTRLLGKDAMSEVKNTIGQECD